MEYIHYGHKHFELNEFEPIRNRELFPKPFGGFWASPVNAEYGWKDWNEAEHFRECKLENSFKFQLDEKAKVLRIKSVNDLEDVLKAATQSPDQVLFLSGMFPSGKRANYAVDLTQE